MRDCGKGCVYSVIVSFGVFVSLSFPISIDKGILGAYATLGQSIILASGFTHPFICCAIDITVLIQSSFLYGDKTVTFSCKYWLLHMHLAISCDPLVQFDD